MGTELIVGIASGALTAAQSFISAEATRKSQEYQALAFERNYAETHRGKDARGSGEAYMLGILKCEPRHGSNLPTIPRRNWPLTNI